MVRTSFASATFEDGGITGAMKGRLTRLRALVSTARFHGGGLAHRHCIAAIRNTNYYELGLLHPLVKSTKPPVYPSEFTDELENVDAQGHVPVPQDPGLGVEMDWDYIEGHKRRRDGV